MKFEYRQIISLNPLQNRVLANLGEEGWELVCVANYKPDPSQNFMCFYFKRMMVDEVLQKGEIEVEADSLQKSLTTPNGPFTPFIHDESNQN